MKDVAFVTLQREPMAHFKGYHLTNVPGWIYFTDTVVKFNLSQLSHHDYSLKF